MDGLIETLNAHPWMWVVVVLAVGAVAYAALKKLLKLAFVFILGLIAVAGYFAYTGKEPPPAMEKVQNTVTDKVKKGASKGVEKAKEVGKKAAKEVKKAAKEGVEDAAKEIGDAAKKGVEGATKEVKKDVQNAIDSAP